MSAPTRLADPYIHDWIDVVLRGVFVFGSPIWMWLLLKVCDLAYLLLTAH